MIIVDFSGVLVASVHSLVKMNDSFDATMYKTLVLGLVISYKKKFSRDYGKLVFAMDSKPYWRTEKFPHYKHGRKASVAKQQAKRDDIDWEHTTVVMNELMDDLQKIFPYKVLKIDKCEADDIIGVLSKELSEPIMIVSRDGDFKQLQRYPNVKQYDPVGKKLMKEPHPMKYLKEHIIRGDRGDGIPNILSVSNSFYDSIRQVTMYTKNVNEWINIPVQDFAETTVILDRFKENESLIDLSKIPDDIQTSIMEEYHKPNEGHNKNVQSYLIKNRLANLLSDLQYFLEKNETPSLANLM